MKNKLKILVITGFFIIINQSQSFACACGCGIFNVATSNIIPNCQGGTAFLQYDHISQTRNFSKHKRSSGHNHDLAIRTQTITAGMQYMFNRKWGAELRLPMVTREIATLNHSASGNFTTTNRNTNLGDIAIKGIYSGLSEDMSTGLIFGLRLPTGETNNKAFVSRNKQIGTGATNSILGAYHIGQIFNSENYNYFTQIIWEKPLIIHRGYHPGQELSGSLGIYRGFSGFSQIKKITPMLQILGTKKQQDTGYADPTHNPNSGYVFGYFAPGIELGFNNFKIYSDIQLPFYRSVNGNQTVPQNLYKIILSYNF